MTSVAASISRFQAVVPQFAVPDVVKTAEYYLYVLGFEIAGYWDGEGVHQDRTKPAFFGIVRRDQVQVFFSRADGASIRTGRAEGAYDAYFNVTGVDALAAELHRRGATILEGRGDRVYEQRELATRDCNGLILAFAESTSRRAT